MPSSFQNGSGNPVTALSPGEALEYLRKGAVLLDIREPYETNFRMFDVPEVRCLPHSEFTENYPDIPAGTPLIVADNVGVHAKEIASFLMAKVYPEVAWIVGGVVDWARANLPLAKDPNYELRGQCSCKLRPKNPKDAPRWKTEKEQKP